MCIQCTRTCLDLVGKTLRSLNLHVFVALNLHYKEGRGKAGRGGGSTVHGLLYTVYTIGEDKWKFIRCLGCREGRRGSK